MKPIPEDHALRQFFRGLVENVFTDDLGVCSPALSDYLSDLLTEFIHVDRLRMIRDADGKPLDQIAEMLALIVEIDDETATSACRKGMIYRHIGDYSLFWTGVYPESLCHHRVTQTKDRLLDYTRQGKRSYAIASGLIREDFVPPPALLRELSDNFESCAHGLELVREEWEHNSPDSFHRASAILL